MLKLLTCRSHTPVLRISFDRIESLPLFRVKVIPSWRKLPLLASRVPLSPDTRLARLHLLKNAPDSDLQKPPHNAGPFLLLPRFPPSSEKRSEERRVGNEVQYK